MKPGWLGFALTLATSLIALPGSALGDQLQGSAILTSVTVSLTLGTGTFPTLFTNGYAGQATISGSVLGQSYSANDGGSLFVSHSAAPLQVSDAGTGSFAESASTVGGSLNGSRTTLTVVTSSNATATSAYIANANSSAGTSGIPQGFALPGTAQPTHATFDIDLMSDFGTNPNSAYLIQLQALGIPPNMHNASSSVEVLIDSNMPGFTVFDLEATAKRVNGVMSFVVQFSSPWIAQPIFASDFIAGPGGTYSLDPNKRHISIPITIPASTSGYQFSVGTGAFVQVTPEPSTFVIAGIGLIALAAIAWRKRVNCSFQARLQP